jgi:hypothetical protein
MSTSQDGRVPPRNHRNQETPASRWASSGRLCLPKTGSRFFRL